jgi:predicted CoA-binding protein
MTKVPELMAEFLRGQRFAVAGVSRHPGQAANAVYRKLRDSGYEVFPLNPTSALESEFCLFSEDKPFVFIIGFPNCENSDEYD